MTRSEPPPVRRFGAHLLGAVISLPVVLSLVSSVFLSCAPGKAPARESHTWVVSRDEPRTHATIGEAIATAAPGDIVRIGPGRWEERVVVDKRLTLVGSSAHETVIVAGVAQGFFSEGESERLQEQLTAARSSDERAELLDAALASKAAVLVTADNVRLEALGVRLEGRGDAGTVQRGAAVILKADGARIRGCAIVGSPCSGVLVEGDDVVVEGSLVAAIEATGIAVAPGSGRVEIRGCDVRDAIHRGITIARDEVLIEGCRISGSSWHGIRYDDVGPTIRNNVITGNKRSGIYASGETSARVTGNLFLQNGFNGMSAWFENGDTLERNTFAHNGRAALEVLGASRPALLGNVFAWSPTGVVLGSIAGDSSDERPNSRSDGSLDLAGNAFYRCGLNALWTAPPTARGEGEPDGPRELTAADRGYEVLDPGFADPRNGDFSLPDGSVGRRRGLGASGFADLSSPWPRRPPEQDAVPAQRPLSLDAPTAPRPPSQSPYAVSKPWVEAAGRSADATRRNEALAQVRAAVDSADPTLVHAGLIAISRLDRPGIDWVPMRPRLRHLCETLTDEAMRRAFYALRAADHEDSDLSLLVARMRAGEVAPQMSHLLMVYGSGDLRGEVAEQLLALLTTTDADDLREVMRGIWGARVDVDVERRLLEISRTRSERDCIYFALSTLKDKSPAVIDRLFEAARSPDSEVFSRALWGLGHGIPEAGRTQVAEGAAALLGESFSPESRQAKIWKDAFQLIEVNRTP